MVLPRLSPYSPVRDPTVIVLAIVVVGTLALMAGGVGNPPIIGGNTSGPLLGGDDSNDDPRLELAANRTTVQAGSHVRFAVTYGNGTPATNAEVVVDGTAHPVSEQGTLVLRMDTAGEYAAHAEVPRSNEPVRSPETTLTVRRRTVELRIATNASTVRTDEPVRIEVSTADGSPASARIEGDGVETATNEQGVAIVRFDRAGERTIVARKDPGPAVEYVPAEVELAVERRAVDLAVVVEDAPATVGDPVRITVTRTDTGAGVVATLGVRGRQLRTNGSGVAVTTFDRAGRVTLTVTANDTPAVTFPTRSATIEVRRQRVALSLSANRTRVTPGDSVRFTVARADNDSPVAATLSVDGTEYETDDDGTLTLSFERQGTVGVRASKPSTRAVRYRPDVVTVDVIGPTTPGAGGLSPRRAGPGGSVA